LTTTVVHSYNLLISNIKPIHLLSKDLIYMFFVLESEENKAAADLNGMDTLTKVVPETVLLDNSANKSKGQLGTAGALASRRPPTKRNKVVLYLHDQSKLGTHLKLYIVYPG